MTYTVTGPFTNGGAPGISATFLNNVENWIEVVDNSTAVTVNGQTAGVATLYQPLQGIAKAIVIWFNGFRSVSGPQNLVLPLAFAHGGFFYAGNITNPATAVGCGFQFLLSSVAQNVNLYNGNHAAPVTGTTAGAMEAGEVTGGFDTLSIVSNANWTGNATGFIVVVGN